MGPGTLYEISQLISSYIRDIRVKRACPIELVIGGLFRLGLGIFIGSFELNVSPIAPSCNGVNCKILKASRTT
jgi:hypothetical protein